MSRTSSSSSRRPSRPPAPSTPSSNSTKEPTTVASLHAAILEETVAAFAPDMPLLMHGAGDVSPALVDGDSAALVAKLTADYVTKLVDHAVMAHDIITEGAGGLIPPAPVKEPVQEGLSYTEEARAMRPGNKHKRVAGEDYWDDPLPELNIKDVKTQTKPKSWVGTVGVDLQVNSRSRKRHVQQAIGVQDFMFAIAHDGELYQRVNKLRMVQSDIQELLMDSAWMSAIAEEEKATKKNPDEDDDDDDDQKEELEWPLESLLPIHKSLQSTEK